LNGSLLTQEINNLYKLPNKHLIAILRLKFWIHFNCCQTANYSTRTAYYH